MSILREAPYILALKEEFIRSHCSACFNRSSNQCAECGIMVYCNDQCRKNDSLFHQNECEVYKNSSSRDEFDELVLMRMMVRVITRLSIDGGEAEIDLCSDVPETIVRRSWFDLLGHRDEIVHSERHWKEWLKTKKQLKHFFPNRFNQIDLLKIFGKLLINRFRVAIFDNLLNGRIAVGWAIYLTTSCFNHSCQPDLLQCLYDINMRLKMANSDQKLPQTTSEFARLTVSYRHQNDFRLVNPFTYVPTRKQRRKFVSFFFFNCHCSFCNDDLRNRYAESATNRLCDRCGDFLILQDNYDDSTSSILTCLGRKKCLNNEQICDYIKVSFIDNHEESINIYEEKLVQIEKILHPESISLLQQREKVFFAYQKLLNRNEFDENQRETLIDRAIQLGELLLQGYDIHLNQSSIYPKILLCDVALLCQIIGKKERAKQLYEKAMDLWREDYANYLDYHHLTVN